MFVRTTMLRALACAVLLPALLSGCVTGHNSAPAFTYTTPDPAKGVVVGTVFERAVFEAHGARFGIVSSDLAANKDKDLWLSSHAPAGQVSLQNVAPKVPTGKGSTFALQLTPGRYRILIWLLDYGSRSKYSESSPKAIEFDVVAGKVIYLGRLDANRFLEVASIHDNFEEDIVYLKKNPLLANASIENKALEVSEWWLKDATGKKLLERNRVN